MKKLLLLFLTTLSALGLTATVTSVYANPVTTVIRIDSSTVSELNYMDVHKHLKLIFEHSGFDYMEGGEFRPSEILKDDEFGILTNYPPDGKIKITHEVEISEIRFTTSLPTDDLVISINFQSGKVGFEAVEGFFVELRATKVDETEDGEDAEDLRPAINGQENFASNVDSPTTVQQMIAQLRAIDDIDGDISHKIVIEKDNFTPNKNTLGRYDVDVSVTDSAGNKTEFKFWVTVADITSPVASADLTPKVISYDKTLDFEALKNTITATDNYYDFSELTVTITRDTYTTNKTKLGTYYVDYTVEDPSQNKTVLTFPIVVKDLVAPVINGITDLVKSYTNIMPLSEILSGITATDAIDGDLTNKITVISDTYTGNANKPGNYVVTIQVADNSGNKTTRDIKIKVIDDKGADWYITNNVTFNLPSDTPMTRAQIIELLTRAGQVQASSLSRVIYSADTYTGNETEPGIYTLAFNVQEPNGNEKAYTYAINVFSTSDEDIDVVPTPPNFIDKTTKFISDNKVSIIAGAVVLITLGVVFTKVKEEARKNKRRRK